ncbi:MAG: hypothetical protein ABW116_00125 [Candidatus Sedimenticola sp. 20ELBAFRAG]
MSVNRTLFISLITVLVLPACSGDPEWVGVYESCQDKVKRGISEMEQSGQGKAMNDMAQSLGMAACEMIKANCEQAPESAACRAIIDGYKQE